jgi:hypothetical protein
LVLCAELAFHDWFNRLGGGAQATMSEEALSRVAFLAGFEGRGAPGMANDPAVVRCDICGRIGCRSAWPPTEKPS